MNKRCPKCGIIKYINEFHKDNNKKDGLCCWCKNCQKEYQQSESGKKVKSRASLKYQKTEKGKEYHKNHENIKYNTDSSFKLLKRLRARTCDALKNNWKSGKTIELLGCSIGKLKQHLESKFTKGMNWENQGQWHIDHIIPCVAFDLSNPEEQRKCFHYTNLQPLWARDNLIKSDKLDWSSNG